MAAGANAVEVTVDVEPKEVGRVVWGAAQLLGNGVGEAQFHQIEGGHEGVDEADGVLLADIVVQGFREEGHLIPVAAFDMAHWLPPRGQGNELDLPYTTPDFSHGLSLELTPSVGALQ